VKKPKIHTCKFVLLSTLIPANWAAQGFYEKISDNAPFSWGDNNRSMVDAQAFADHCQDRLDDSAKVREWLKKIRNLGQTYIDLEN